MKRHFLAVLLILTGSVELFAEDFNLDKGIALTKENERGSISMAVKKSIELKSPFDRGVVVRWSNSDGNATRLGQFVEIEYEMGYEFEGTFVSQGKMRVVFSNLGSLSVNEKTPVMKGTSLGFTKSGEGGDLRVFVLSDTDDLKFLQKWTGNKKLKVEDTWYWDPSFLFR